MQVESCKLAFENAINSLRPETRFPENVFAGTWTNFLFLESDDLFFGNFVWGIKEFLRIESASVACMVNLTRKADGSTRSAIYLDRETTSDSYQEQLRANNIESAWLYQMEDYACASEGGSWCIYAERASELAVIALRDIGASTQFHFALRYLGADTLTYLLRSRLSFIDLLPDWRAGLIRNYKPSKGRSPL